jgi:hypothetical protein
VNNSDVWLLPDDNLREKVTVVHRILGETIDVMDKGGWMIETDECD